MNQSINSSKMLFVHNIWQILYKIQVFTSWYSNLLIIISSLSFFLVLKYCFRLSCFPIYFHNTKKATVNIKSFMFYGELSLLFMTPFNWNVFQGLMLIYELAQANIYDVSIYSDSKVYNIIQEISEITILNLDGFIEPLYFTWKRLK